jgi:UDP-GlcNAc3NAcA epimerase
MKLITVLGARPQFIKASSLSRYIVQQDKIKEVIVHTGQHFDSNMSNIFFEEMNIPKPMYQFELGGFTHGAMTGRMLEKIEEVLVTEKPDILLVYGDTNSTLAGALAAGKMQIPVAHVEAGLRSFNMAMPEEINRILTDRISNLLFCPTDTAVENLTREGFDAFDCQVKRSGDIMKDGAEYYRSRAKRPDLKFEKEFFLATIHRAENTNDISKLKSIISAFNVIAETKQLVLPLHPRTRKLLAQIETPIKFQIIDPVGYLEMIWLIANCQMVLTDSGGLQKEAFFFAKPCITLRDETEWTELVDHRFNCLTGTAEDKILEGVHSFSFNTDFGVDLYGDGNASKIIHDSLLSI